MIGRENMGGERKILPPPGWRSGGVNRCVPPRSPLQDSQEKRAGRAKTHRDFKALRMSVLLPIPRIPKQPFATAASSSSAPG